MFLASVGFTFDEFFSLAEVFFDTVVSLNDFFFKYRSFRIPLPISSSDTIVSLLGSNSIGFEGSIVHMLLGVGLSAVLGFKLVKFFLDIIL